MESRDVLECAACGCDIEYGNSYIDEDGADVCESCEANAWNYANTVVVISDGEVTKFLHSSMGWREAEYFEQESPDAVEKFEYKSTDGWRGYHQPVLADGYVTLADGWSTGNYSDVPWKHKFNNFVSELASGEKVCPVDVTLAYGLTSNVFSVSTDIIVASGDVDEFTAWVANEMGYSVDDLQAALV
jgi:hypothetical protein